MLRHSALLALGLLACLSVLFANGAPLFYFDTVGYIDQGQAMLGLAEALPPAEAAPPASEAPSPAPPAAEPDTTVVGSRSAAYSAVMALLDRVLSLEAVVIANLAVIAAATALAARHVAPGAGLRATGLALLAGALGALPFYVAYLMPDILAPVLILTVATVCVWGPAMGWGALALAAFLALAAILAHPSHLLLMVGLLPFCLLASPLLAGHRAKTALAFAGLLAVAGLGERLIFSNLVERFENKSVVYLPFLTARLIDDGPGLAYLAETCGPDAPSRPSCELYAVLQTSDDPKRLDAPNIIFAQNEWVGSLQRLPQPVQDRIAREQVRFAVDVLRWDPWGVARAVAANVGTQLLMTSAGMTLHPEGQAGWLRDAYGPVAASLEDGRLERLGPEARRALDVAHNAVYALSLLAILALLWRNGRRDLWLFAGLVGLGIVVNALVCAGISEPAPRYHARVALLLPILAALLAAAPAAPRGPATLPRLRSARTG
ncbi:hypothetical protein [Rubellimicrobium roseum]|uniref:Glycosyltransferase RgtA/B/C/D-like domain-containing protein n=1 Tax=Rubellimicrobium roseum TaxID=687525 RepID=A0A5C4NG19_9RHOB|nr:hypothetical protein [Rubellimicrobium roseum]TNC71389.1 hypothetical protein FHG71_11580 [Rubellimicrobium roseum]